jgi:preprotein translocase subunit SecF
MELFRIKNDIPFMSYGRLTTSISLVTFLLAIVFLATRGLNFGVDLLAAPSWKSTTHKLPT